MVDDGSPTPLDDLVAAFQSQVRVTLIRQANAGPAAARNAAAHRATGEYLAFTDDDVCQSPAGCGRWPASGPSHPTAWSEA